MKVYFIYSINRNAVTHSMELAELIKFCWQKSSKWPVNIVETDVVDFYRVSFKPMLQLDGSWGLDEATFTIEINGLTFYFTVCYSVKLNEGVGLYNSCVKSSSIHVTDPLTDFDEEVTGLDSHICNWLSQLADNWLTNNQHDIDRHIEKEKRNAEEYDERI